MAEHSHSQTMYDSHGEAHALEHAHPDWGTYKWVAIILTVITALEVWVYYTPLKETRLFVPVLLAMSVAKFAIVVMFYMHLKYDAKLFRGLFVGPLIIAIVVLISLLFLFGHLALHV
ncbi:MAG TPA: cytochrome C oxidase subunit IV family protein [Gemmatimonadaceae bacterium]|nr:cytochrome C oxidase subunit IV family protein [Gemmatimonadaceae bacterium]